MEEQNGMTAIELDSFLEILAKLIEAKTGNTEAAKIVRDAKTSAQKQK